MMMILKHGMMKSAMKSSVKWVLSKLADDIVQFDILCQLYKC